MPLDPKATKVRIRAELDAVEQLRENLQKAIVVLGKKRLGLQSAYKALQDVESADEAIETIAHESHPLQSTIDWGEDDPPLDTPFGGSLVRPEEPASVQHLLPETLKRYR